MSSPTFDLFRTAIEQKLQVTCFYQGHIRVVCPHVVGYSKTGGEQVLVYQFDGTSSRGLPPGGEWRCFVVSLVQRAATRPGAWHTGASHMRPQTCVHTIVAEVVY